MATRKKAARTTGRAVAGASAVRTAVTMPATPRPPARPSLENALDAVIRELRAELNRLGTELAALRTEVAALKPETADGTSPPAPPSA